NMLTALLAAVSAVSVGAAIVLVGTGATWPRTLAAVAGLALLLRSRAYKSFGQRTALIAGGATVLALTMIGLAREGSWLLPAASGAALGIAGLAHALRAPRNNPSPYWGRFLEVIEFFALVSLVPLAAAVLDLYQRARSLA